MNACLSKTQLEAQIGPLTWRPSKSKCHHRHWNEREIKAKERADKERSKKERHTKERQAKERNGKEKKAKERNEKHERSNKAKARERNTKNARIKVSKHYWGGWLNNWDATLHWSIGGNQFFSGLMSYHHNG